jgi:hypothetical protein
VIVILIALSAAATEPQIKVFGHGNVSCATAFAAENVSGTRAWITGFWSGLNAGLNSPTGQATDTDGIIAEVKLTCDQAPSQRLFIATFDAWKKLSDAGR